ncbi:MAG: sigma 54-interacting transcriptional regulator, partial [Candidatus Methylomirabilis sp.]|nr:sigma 54-interacting transcriptional regulator [Deltaproteobacteria bacterium]
FELAHGGTLFLDEVGTMSPTLQAKLLRVLQEQTFERVGGKDKIHVDVRIVSATHENLERAVQEGRFREDLYYRMVAFPIQVPPLRDRKEDMPALIAHFLAHFSERARKPARGFTAEAMGKLLEYHWPGNIRELENVIYRAVVLAEEDEIGVGCLAPEVVTPSISMMRPSVAGEPVEAAFPGDKIMPFDEVEKRAIERALRLTGGNISRAARELRIGRATFYRKLEKYDLAREAV